MKKLIALLLCFTFLLTPSFAHSGGTDGSGGHWNRATGEYHYHHGHPEHQHTDGLCPYDFVDATEPNEGTGGLTSKHDPTPESAGNNTGQHTAKNSMSDVLLCIGVLSFFPALIFLGTSLSVVTERAKQRKERKEYEAKKSHYKSIYGYRFLDDIAFECGMPEMYTIGDDGLPKDASSVGWGDSLTFYVSPNGKAYHRNNHCTKNATIPCHAVRLNRRYPCNKCRPIAPDTSWYDAYSRIDKLIKEYDIPTLQGKRVSFICGTALSRGKPIVESTSLVRASLGEEVADP